MLGRFAPPEAEQLFTYAKFIGGIWDGEAAVPKSLARALPEAVFILPVPPSPHAAMELVYVRDGQRIVVLGGYLMTDSRQTIQSAVLAAIRRRPGWIHW